MKSPLTLTLAAVLAVSAAAPVAAQTYDSEYQQRLREWQAERDRYEAQRQAYEADRRAWEQRYGRSGAYSPYDRPAPYGPDYRAPPPYDPRYDRRDYDYDRRDYDRYGAADPYRSYRDSPCERRASSSDRRVAGTVLGALVGGALGANIASDKVETEGAVLGAVVGGALGNAIARGETRDLERYGARCDDRGYYYTYEETFPYREDVGYRGRRSGRFDYDYYARNRCRLAIAPAEWDGRVDYRYIRVCPDAEGRFRITA
jgi:hypothetical protein